jgi:capsular exopolysaccharide synthesis family protein
LVEVISGQLGLEQAIHSTEPEGRGIHFMTAGKHTPQATELVRSQQMAAIIARLKNMYTLVIIDSPPVLPVADARMIANLVERVIYVVRWNEARREVVGHAVKQLRDAGAQFAGVVLNAVNVRRHAEYGYSDSGYYYGKQRKYYTE